MKTGDVVDGRYRIIRTLGEGGMGTVFLAEHTLIKRRVAVKVLHPELAADVSVIERFMNEARAAGTLGHPNIVESTDMGYTKQNVPFIVFEYLEGALLTDEIYRVGGLPVRRAVRIAEQIASALAAAHSADIVHRDLKSDNVFLTDRDELLDHVKVLDFGISRFLQHDDKHRNMVLGTPEFMAPEQITAPESVDARADIYALGVILYEMLTARRPFSNEDDPRALMHRIVHEPPPPLQRPEVPESLARILLNKLLAKDPAQRFQSMADVEAALVSYATGQVPAAAIRRRTASTKTVEKTEFDVAQAETAANIPRLAKASSYPSSPHIETLDMTPPPQSLQAVALGPPPAVKRPYVLYGIAGAGIAIGAIGLVMGLTKEPPQPPAQVIVQAPPPAPQPAAAIPVPPAPQKIPVALEADAPNARIVFRRRVNGSPATMTITASDIVEMVEISAPGYQTERYWLTFDRPTHLRAHLEKGTGIAEATEEETLVALGEVAAPAPAIAAAAAQPQEEVAAARKAPTPERGKAAVTAVTPTEKATEKAVEKTTEVAAAPAGNADELHAANPADATRPVAIAATPAPQVAARRKIGRAAAEAAPALATTTAEPAAELPSATVTPPVATDEPIPPPAVEKPVAPEPVIEKPAFDHATVTSVVAKHRPEVIKCFTEGKKKDPKMKGTLTLQLLVDAAGKVHRVQVQSTLSAPAVAACIVKSANSWKFPARAGGDIAPVAYPFTVN